MTWLLATAVLLVGAPFVLWPLARHWQPQPERLPGPEDGPDRRRLELEELDLDLDAGRLSEAEAAQRRRELP